MPKLMELGVKIDPNKLKDDSPVDYGTVRFSARAKRAGSRRGRLAGPVAGDADGDIEPCWKVGRSNRINRTTAFCSGECADFRERSPAFSVRLAVRLVRLTVRNRTTRPAGGDARLSLPARPENRRVLPRRCERTPPREQPRIGTNFLSRVEFVGHLLNKLRVVADLERTHHRPAAPKFASTAVHRRCSRT